MQIHLISFFTTMPKEEFISCFFPFCSSVSKANLEFIESHTYDFFPFYKRDTTFTYYPSSGCAEIFSIPFHIRDLDLDPYNVLPHPVNPPSILYNILFLCSFAFYLEEKVGGGRHPCPHLCISSSVIYGHPV